MALAALQSSFTPAPQIVPVISAGSPGEEAVAILDFRGVAPVAEWVWLPPLKTAFPDGWRGAQFDYRLLYPPFPVNEQQFNAWRIDQQAVVPTPVGGTSSLTTVAVLGSVVGPFGQLPVTAQQAAAVVYEGWRNYQWEYKFAAPLNGGQQQFSAFQPQGFIQSSFPDGWRSYQLDYRFKAPFLDQQWSSFEAAGFIKTTFPDGWASYQWDYRFKAPYLDQQFNAFEPAGFVKTAFPEGWRTQLEFKFAANPAVDGNQSFVSTPFQSIEGWRGDLAYRFTATTLLEGYSVQPNSPLAVIAFPNGWQIDQATRFANIAPGPQPFQAIVWTIVPAPATGQWSWQATGDFPTIKLSVPLDFGPYPLGVPPAPLPPVIISPPGHGDLRKRLRLNRGIRPIWDVVRDQERQRKAKPPASIIELPDTTPPPAQSELKTEVSRKALTLPRENVPLPPFAYSLAKPKLAAKKRTQLTHREAQEILLMTLALLEDEDED